MAARLSDSVVWTGKPGKNHPSSIQAKAKHLCNGVLTRDGTTLSHLGEVPLKCRGTVRFSRCRRYCERVNCPPVEIMDHFCFQRTAAEERK
jgi:hypothetical protein